MYILVCVALIVMQQSGLARNVMPTVTLQFLRKACQGAVLCFSFSRSQTSYALTD